MCWLSESEQMGLKNDSWSFVRRKRIKGCKVSLVQGQMCNRWDTNTLGVMWKPERHLPHLQKMQALVSWELAFLLHICAVTDGSTDHHNAFASCPWPEKWCPDISSISVIKTGELWLSVFTAQVKCWQGCSIYFFLSHTKKDPSSKPILPASQFGQLKTGGNQVGWKNFSLLTSSFHSCCFTYKEVHP